MYILTDKENRVISISETLSRQDNGNYLVNNGNLAIAEYLVVNTYEKNETIEEKYNSSKYCYTEEKGFYVDPNWKPHYSIEERLASVEDAVNSILLG